VKNLLQKAVKLAPQSAEAHYQLGQMAMRQGRLKDAEGELLLSLQSEPDQSKAHYALSVVYRRMGRTDEATKQFAIYESLQTPQERGTPPVTTSVEKP
jgi:Flp pilus assembly protein TadD